MWKAKYECSTAMASEINTWHYTTIYYSHKSKLASLSNELGTRDKWYEAQHYQFSYKHLCPDADDMHKEIFRSVFRLWLHINKEYRNNEKMLWQKKAWNRNFHHARSNTSSSTRFSLSRSSSFPFLFLEYSVVPRTVSICIWIYCDKKLHFL